jgi:hypothetical protein
LILSVPSTAASSPRVAQDLVQPPPAAPAQAGRSESPLGPPIVIEYDAPGADGEAQRMQRTIGANDLKRYLALGLGRQQAEAAKVDVIIENELAMRAAAGEDISIYDVPKEKVDATLEKQRVEFLEKYPTLDFPTEVGRAFLSLDLYRDQLAQTLLFDRVFLPDNPDEWPPLTTEAIIQGTGGTAFVEDAKESYEHRHQQQLAQGLDEIPPDDPIFTDYLRSMVLETLLDFSTIVTNPPDLPEGVLYVIDSVPVKIDTIFDQVAPLVTRDQVEDARLFLTLMTLAEIDLAASGELLSQFDFEHTWQPGTPYAAMLKSHDMLARNVLGFPSLWTYEYYLRVQYSLRRRLAAELEDKELLGSYIPYLDKIAGAGKVDTEVILAAAYDWPNVRWKPDGWAYAEKRASAIKKMLDEGADWKETLDLHSEFWDPPLPEAGRAKPEFGYNFKGRFGPQTRNQLLGRFEESEFTIFLRQDSVADRVFFDQEVNTVIGPFKGTRGYYISRLQSRTRPSSGLRLNEPKHIEFIVDHHMRRKFAELAHGLLAKAKSEGRLTGF